MRAGFYHGGTTREAGGRGAGATTGPPADAPVNACLIVGGPQAPLDVRIYESDPYGSPGGRRLFIGTLNRNERHLIQTPTGRIWYEFRWHEGDSWRGGHEAPCRDRAALELP